MLISVYYSLLSKCFVFSFLCVYNICGAEEKIYTVHHNHELWLIDYHVMHMFCLSQK